MGDIKDYDHPSVKKWWEIKTGILMVTDKNQPSESMGFSGGLRQQLIMLCFD